MTLLPDYTNRVEADPIPDARLLEVYIGADLTVEMWAYDNHDDLLRVRVVDADSDLVLTSWTGPEDEMRARHWQTVMELENPA